MWIVLIVCMAGASQHCKQVSAGKTDAMGCMIESVTQAAEWSDKHPGWEVKRFWCQNEDPENWQDL